MPEPDVPTPSPDGLVPVELYTVWGREWGWISSGDERTSDWLNRADTLSLHGISDLPLVGDAPTTGEPGEVANRPDFERLAADVVMVVPPALPANRHLRLHRRIVEVRMELASFALVGRVHIRPGAKAGDYLLRGNRRFVPITNAELTYTGETPFRRHLPVVIVNVTHVTLLDRGPGAAEEMTLEASLTDAGAPPATVTEPSGVTADAFLSAREALEQLAGLAKDGLITAAEHRRKRGDILARL
jgi:hypothetical protein